MDHLVVAAFIWRRQPEAHKRLMLLATIDLLNAAVARWPLALMANGPPAFFAVTDLFIVAGVVFDAASPINMDPENASRAGCVRPLRGVGRV
jgi:hypothetical protein